MNGSEDKSKGESAAGFRILDKDLFLYLLDLEVKRARRYQNFISILLMKLVPFSKEGNGKNFGSLPSNPDQCLEDGDARDGHPRFIRR